MPTVVIIGASRGIGLGLTRYYTASGWTVIATTRTADTPGDLGRLGSDVALYQVDVQNAADIEALANAMDGNALDIVIHNAGISGRDNDPETVMRVNADAPITVAHALMPALRRAASPKLLLMTSQLGARRGQTRSLGLYGDSKAALNDRFRDAEPAWRADGVTSIVMHPGWVRTDMGGASAPLSVDQSVHGIVTTLDGLTLADSGRFLTWEGRDHPW